MPEVVQVDFKLKLEEPSSNIVHLSNISMHEIHAICPVHVQWPLQSCDVCIHNNTC